MENFLENNIARFVQILRSLGLQIGTSEILDAMSAVKNIDLTERILFQSALKATLVKDAIHYPLFDNAFIKFFVESPKRESQIEEKKEYLEGLEEAKKELEFQEEPLNLEQQYIEMYSQLPREARQQVKDFLKKTSEGKNVSPKFKPVVENVIKGALEYHRTHRDLPQMLPVEMTGIEEVDAILHQIAYNKEAVDLFFQNMAAINA
ncbi:MAG: hypothetical protein AAGU27_10795, partial [Dehalobacterium sp.]